MDDRRHVGTLLVDLAVDVALAVEAVLRRPYGRAVQVEGEQILFGDETRREMSRHHVLLRIAVVTHADVAERVDDSIFEENFVPQQQVLNQLVGKRSESTQVLLRMGKGKRENP